MEAPAEGLFTKKWWAKITAEDDFWVDLAYNVPKAVLRKRVKQSVVIDHDVRSRARKKEEERLARERRRTQALKVARSSKQQHEPTSSHNDLPKSPANTVATGDTTSLPSVLPAIGDKGVKDGSHNDVVEKFECAKCDHFCLKDEMSPIPSDGSICKQCFEGNAVKTEEMLLVPAAESSSRGPTARPSTLWTEWVTRHLCREDPEVDIRRAAARAKEDVSGSERKRIKLEPVDNGSGRAMDA
ncbi:hypothetical protein LTS17_000538 [Exophiala oligosperma]